MSEETDAILTKGLLEGYAGRGVRGLAQRAGFKLETSDYSGPEGKYHDEWLADYNGGGQELAEAPSGEKATRVYAGGTLAEEKLRAIGLTKREVIGELIFFISELEGKTRLHHDAGLVHGDYEYTYKILRKAGEIPVEVAEEIVRHAKSKTVVFVHYHILSPIK